MKQLDKLKLALIESEEENQGLREVIKDRNKALQARVAERDKLSYDYQKLYSNYYDIGLKYDKLLKQKNENNL